MNFSDAIKMLKEGYKITRDCWIKDDMYFQMIEEDIFCYKPRLEYFLYDEKIMISEGWVVFDSEEERSFVDTIPYLQKGYNVKLKEWESTHIYLDPDEKVLIRSSMDQILYSPLFSDFIAKDWVII